MAVAAYYAWDRLGRPLEPAQPVREFVEKMRVAYPRAKNLFSWYADERHYQAEPPQDHTPYSATGWPLDCPPWWVFATDIMHRPDLGVDCFTLFGYWLSEAKAGRMPWLKYMIWRGQRYDVRNQWRPVASSGHFGHVHLSGRTDHQHTSLGVWSPAPPAPPTTLEDDRMLFRAQLADGTRLVGNGRECWPFTGDQSQWESLGWAITNAGAVLAYGTAPAEYYYPIIGQPVSETPPPGGGLTEQQAEDAAFRGAQRAEDE